MTIKLLEGIQLAGVHQAVGSILTLAPDAEARHVSSNKAVYTVPPDIGDDAVPVTARKTLTGGIEKAADGFIPVLSPRVNLFDKTKVVSGFMGSNGILTASVTYLLSDYMPVKPGVTYYGGAVKLSGMRFTCYFDANKNVLNVGSATEVTTTTAPADAAYIRVTLFSDQEDCMQFFEGSVFAPYKPYGFDLTAGDNTAYYIKSGWSGLKWGHYGDSTSDSVPWMWNVAGRLNMTPVIYSAGGRLLSYKTGAANAMCLDASVNALANDANVVSILAGLNDWAQDTPLGLASSTNQTDFNGAINQWVTKVCARFPTAVIIIFGTTYGELIDLTGRPGWTDGRTNTLGLTPSDYADALKAAAARWNIPYVDFDNECGINRLNITNYAKPDGGLLHYNLRGRDRMIRVALSKMLNLAPV